MPMRKLTELLYKTLKLVDDTLDNPELSPIERDRLERRRKEIEEWLMEHGQWESTVAKGIHKD